MPKSRVRRKAVYTPPPSRSPSKRRSAPWVGGVMLACFLIGILWLVLYYVSNGDMPGLRVLGAWNLVVGFGFILAGFGLATQWR